MKLKFTEETQKIINYIAALPDVVTTTAIIDEPMNTIRMLDQKLNEAPRINKVWYKTRREASFLLFFLVGIEEKISDKYLQYKAIVKAIKDIKTGKALKDISFVRLGLINGIIRLSDVEIKHLIENNRI